MPTLRLTQSAVGENRFRVEAALEGDGLPRKTATTEFDFHFTPQDREDLRWYLEEYLQYDADPAPAIAARIEARIAEVGVGLFKSIFQADEDARDLWAQLRDRLNDTRIEIITGVQEATALPWELLRDPKTDTPLALRADAFVRASHQTAKTPHISPAGAGPIRILLVICRPGGSDDVPFRSVASKLIKGLSESAREAFQLDVLRPPTFGQLSKVLRAAKANGKPYHVVHFDGHGTYEELNEPGILAEIRRGLNSLVLSGARAGAHGYLLFENPVVEENMQLVDGPALGKLLAETHVPVLVLNACRSAHAEAPAAPTIKGEQKTSGGPGKDVHTKVRAFGSLAQEVVDAGVAGVVAMRYNVYVVTAAQFVADLYESLAGGWVLGEAVTLGRKQLEAQPLREIAYEPRMLQDWMVPIVYEAAPVPLFSKPAQTTELKITVSASAAAPSSSELASEVQRRPDAGFFGRDETLLALDRAFDTQQVVLLHAYAGSGKTSTAAEFARWYHLTGGIDGPVLFTSFEQYKPLAQVLNETVGRVFGDALEQLGVHWLTLTDEQRREVALQVMSQIPVLWIWDNVEPVAGFPAGTESAWSESEQHELADFLRAAKQTKAKFLLTSRRDERGWLGDLPARIVVPPMPMQERVQLARAIAEKYGRRLADVEDWIPLLRFTRGNPLTITVLVGQALRDGLKTKEQVESFVAKLSLGEAAFEDEASEGRDKSLGASLGYGFENAFSEVERRQLALLHFFQGFIDVDALRLMGEPDADWSLPEVRGMTREMGIALLDRTSELGLLTAHGRGFYSIHPALPWYFKSLFAHYYPPLGASGETQEIKATGAFVEAMAALASWHNGEYQQGNRDVIALLSAEEGNLLHARQLSLTHGWWRSLGHITQGLDSLYGQTGRRAEWRRLVNEILPYFVDPTTDGPLTGREGEWSVITQYRIRLAFQERNLDFALHLQTIRVEWHRHDTASLLLKPPDTLNPEERHRIRNLAASFHGLAEIQRELNQPQCVVAYEESLKLSEQINEQMGAAACAFNLGRAFGSNDIPSLRNLSLAEHWYRRSLELYDKRDRRGRALSLGQLGSVARLRYYDAKEAGEPEAVRLSHLDAAARLYHEALDMLPENAINDLAVMHNQLGNTYGNLADFDRALRHWREAIRYKEMSGDEYEAAMIRHNVGMSFMLAGRGAEALEYARAALRNFETFGDRAAANIKKAQELIEWIESQYAEGD